MSKPPPVPKHLRNLPKGVRKRYRQRSQNWRLWWEPTATQQEVGAKPVELDADKMTWSIRRAKEAARAADLALGKAQPERRHRGHPGKGSIDALCELYLSPKNVIFHKRAAATQKGRRYDIEVIRDRWGGQPVSAFTPALVFEWYETLFEERGIFMARRLVMSLSALMAYGRKKGMVQFNPCHGLGLQTPPRRKRLVTWEEFDAMEAAARKLGHISIVLALYLGRFQGQRAKDVREARVGDFIMHQLRATADGTDLRDPELCWKLKRSKDKTREQTSHLLIHPEVIPHLKAAMAGREPNELIISRKTGFAYDEYKFPSDFAEVRVEAAKTCPTCSDIQFKDLRRSFSSGAHHAGIDLRAVDDALGNTAGSDPTLSQTYSPASDVLAATATEAITRPKPKGQQQA